MGIIARAIWKDVVHSNDTYHPGDEIPADHPKIDWLLRSGIATKEGQHRAPKATPTPKVEEPKAAPARREVKRPSKAAKLAVWQDYARSQGLDPKKMTREDLIARFT